MINGDPWFVVRDVLGVKDTSMALKNTSQACVMMYKTPGTRGRESNLVEQAGLYKLVFRSDKPNHERNSSLMGSPHNRFTDGQ
ncbi:BRO family protein [Thioclava sp. JE_KL1]|uniref:BRO family protein n=1 Tax=Thioclava sp. JE_KL1 TaxID=2651187 RepID=UPI00128B4DCE|nr:BRO family protein [Thioclava sp. JE_KL1]MPQ96169.1 hypothetical protein [Thioclava sp. JE_KL1]